MFVSFSILHGLVTSVSTFRATVAAVCLVGIFALCCLGCLNTVAIASLRRFSVSLAKETRDQHECEQNRVNRIH